MSLVFYAMHIIASFQNKISSIFSHEVAKVSPARYRLREVVPTYVLFERWKAGWVAQVTEVSGPAHSSKVPHSATRAPGRRHPWLANPRNHPNQAV